MNFYRKFIAALFIVIFAFAASSCKNKKSQQPPIKPHEVNEPSEATKTSTSSPNLTKGEESAQLSNPIPVQSVTLPRKTAPAVTTNGTASLLPIQEGSAQLGNPIPAQPATLPQKTAPVGNTNSAASLLPIHEESPQLSNQPIPVQSGTLLQKPAPVSNTNSIAPTLRIHEEPTQPNRQHKPTSIAKFLSSVFKTDTASQTIRKPGNNTPPSYSSFPRRNLNGITKQFPPRNKACFPTTNNSSLHRELNRRFAGGENGDS